MSTPIDTAAESPLVYLDTGVLLSIADREWSTGEVTALLEAIARANAVLVISTAHLWDQLTAATGSRVRFVRALDWFPHVCFGAVEAGRLQLVALNRPSQDLAAFAFPVPLIGGTTLLRLRIVDALRWKGVRAATAAAAMEPKLTQPQRRRAIEGVFEIMNASDRAGVAAAAARFVEHMPGARGFRGRIARAALTSFPWRWVRAVGERVGWPSVERVRAGATRRPWPSPEHDVGAHLASVLAVGHEKNEKRAPRRSDHVDGVHLYFAPFVHVFTADAPTLHHVRKRLDTLAETKTVHVVANGDRPAIVSAIRSISGAVTPRPR